MKMKVLMISPECAPYSKVGGLGDMVSSISKQFADSGCDVKVFTPLYATVKRPETIKKQMDNLSVKMGLGLEYKASVWTSMIGKAQMLFLGFNMFYDRLGIYNFNGVDFSDNGGRFAFMCRAALDWCLQNDWIPDVIHCHDWTTGLVPVYLNTSLRDSPLGGCASVMTIHNLQHQGIFDKGVLEYAGIPMREFRADSCESYGSLNMLKGGLYNCTKITTVSPTYAQEIRTPQYGCGLDALLRFRGSDLIGIINGVDTDVWNPSTDAHITANYSLADMQGKAKCKKQLQKKMGLKVSAKTPIFGVVSRLYSQKGLDLLARIAGDLVENMDIQIALLGSGESWLEKAFSDLSGRFAGKIATYIGFDNPLSHMIEAGADFFVMPSRFEPCGLNQMYSMIYGTLPIVRSTGGLADTVAQYNESTVSGDGFKFDDASCEALYNTIGWACSTWFDRPDDISVLRRNGMYKDFSWSGSAEKYAMVYKWATAARSAGM